MHPALREVKSFAEEVARESRNAVRPEDFSVRDLLAAALAKKDKYMLRRLGSVFFAPVLSGSSPNKIRILFEAADVPEYVPEYVNWDVDAVIVVHGNGRVEVERLDEESDKGIEKIYTKFLIEDILATFPSLKKAKRVRRHKPYQSWRSFGRALELEGIDWQDLIKRSYDLERLVDSYDDIPNFYRALRNGDFDKLDDTIDDIKRDIKRIIARQARERLVETPWVDLVWPSR